MLRTWSIALLALLPLSAAAQMGPPGGGRGGRGPGAMYMQYFDPKTVTTLEGTITEVRKVPHRGMNMTGTHVTLKTAEGNFDVHLGPSWFIENQELQLKANETIRVTGSKVTIDKTPSVIATEVQRGDDVLKLREPDGTPLWSAWRRRGQ
ncbi:MAG: DNA-binding protein [Deltaproteobacteria bacterium]|nr:DNA-binding protein [Deltaproteobacteria bacterium]